MSAKGRTFVGFGFGPIQSALFLYEAYDSGNFDRLVVSEVDPELVQTVRDNGGNYTINIARMHIINQVTVPNVEIYNPTVAADRAKLIEAIGEADEMATALPSVDFFDRGATSVAKLISAGLAKRDGKPGVIYAAENNNHAAQALTKCLEKYAAADDLSHVQVLNTVIGKMSGVLTDFGPIVDLGLKRMTPQYEKAVLVEEFNHILISKITLDGFERGISVFVEKDDLRPFEEAKLYGHNAVHALIGYQAARRGLRIMASAAVNDDLLMSAITAFNVECGPALIHKWGKTEDRLFTPMGFREYSNDLIRRMLNPRLHDLVGRVIRDPLRKLGWDDRLIGTMRLVIEAGIEPKEMGKGAAGALMYLIEMGEGVSNAPKALAYTQKSLGRESMSALLDEIWEGKAEGEMREKLIDMIFRGVGLL